MKLFGYAKKDVGDGLLEMKEVSISANPANLRALATFLQSCADGIEKDPKRWGHEHFRSTRRAAVAKGPDVIVCNPKIK